MKEYRRLLVFTRPYRWEMAFAMLTMTVYGAVNMAPAPLVKKLLDDVFIAKDPVMLYRVIGLILGAFTLKGILFYAQHYISLNIGHKVVRDLRNTLYEKYMGLPLSFYTGAHSGDLTSRLLADIQQVRDAMTVALMQAFRHLVSILALLGYILYAMNPRFYVFAFLILPIAGGFIAYFGKFLRRYSLQGQKETAVLSTVLLETLNGIRIVKAFGMEAHEIERFRRIDEFIYRLQMKVTRLTGISPALMEWLGAIGLGAFLLYGGNMAVQGQITTGEFFAFLTSAGLMYDPVKKLDGLNAKIQNGLAAAERIFEILDGVNPITDPPQPRPFPSPIREGICFRGVEFAYGNGSDSLVLKGIDLDVRPGEIIALVGSSGAGKTSLVNLIPRFYDVTAGAVAVDGVDLREFRIADLRARIAMVTQETFLFNDTIRANIAYGPEPRDLDAVRAAAEAANARSFIEVLPDGYDTILGERGMTLSGGQRQRLAIARAILKNAPILILDEATSSLDSESEKEVQKAIDRLIADRTTFVIAHRLSTIRHADRILVLRDGRIVETGNHEALLARRGEYHRLYTQQYFQTDDAVPAAS